MSLEQPQRVGPASNRPVPLEYRRLRAPAEDGGVLIEPTGDSLTAMIDANREQFRESSDVDLWGRSFYDLVSAAREQMLGDAVQYVGQYRDADGDDSHAGRRTPRIYLAGHQPELFHPGVWLKNFVLDAMAKRDGATAVHVLIDNDEVRSPALRVPTGSLDEPHIETIPLDADAPPCTWEERTIRDKQAFLSFADRTAEAIAHFVADPLVREMWRDATAALDVTNNLGQCLAQMRHKVEAAWGIRTLEIPLSHICRSQPFSWFTALLLAQAERLIEVHNRTLAEYRRVHRLRSHSHPVPDLAAADGWLEMPLWMWTPDDPQRRRVFVRHHKETLELSDGASRTFELAGPADGDVARLAADLMQLQSEGVKLRPRALLTTMYLRAVLSDVFVHGIGGAKYDQVTDRLIAEVLGIAPPGFVTASGTRLLPIDRPPVSQENIRNVDRALRDCEFHPERFIEPDAIADEGQRREVQSLLAEKQSVLAAPLAGAASRQRHAALSRINERLAHHVSSRREQLLRQREALVRHQRASANLSSREMAACLFPEKSLRPWLLDAASKAF